MDFYEQECQNGSLHQSAKKDSANLEKEKMESKLE
jgi:hypothetical protein